MISNEVIQEIYKSTAKPPKHSEDLGLEEHLERLRAHHHITLNDPGSSMAEVVLDDLEDTSPFKRFLVRSLHGVLEFDKSTAFAFKSHILFLSNKDNQLRVHFKPSIPDEDEEDEEDGRSFFSRLFGRKNRN